jgi:hypothetical protein
VRGIVLSAKAVPTSYLILNSIAPEEAHSHRSANASPATPDNLLGTTFVGRQGDVKVADDWRLSSVDQCREAFNATGQQRIKEPIPARFPRHLSRNIWFWQFGLCDVFEASTWLFLLSISCLFNGAGLQQTICVSTNQNSEVFGVAELPPVFHGGIFGGTVNSASVKWLEINLLTHGYESCSAINH